MTWLFLLAYTLSGLAGLIYQVSWTRLLTLYIGHTTAAASAVVAAFLGGLAVGAAVGGAIASRLTPRRSLYVYAALEAGVGLVALLLPFELTALTPLLEWSYRSGEPGLLFPAIRLMSCLVIVFVPAAALGATFPMAIRWFAAESTNAARASGALYAANTTGAAAGALIAGFILIPSIGLAATTHIGVAASVLAAAAVLAVAQVDRRSRAREAAVAAAVPVRPPRTVRPKRSKSAAALEDAAFVPVAQRRWLAVTVLGLSGFAALVHEIAWTRILALLLGPTIYAFSAALAAVIAGVAIGSAIGSWIAGRTRHPAGWLSFTLAAAALTASWTSALAGGQVPRLVAQQMASSPDLFDQLLRQGTILTATLILPTAACLGAAFPLALAIAGGSGAQSAGRFGVIYAINTLGAVSGTLIAGFVFIPRLGLQATLSVVSACLIAAALIVVIAGRLPRTMRIGGAAAAVAAVALVALSPPWDRELLASGGYLYAPFVPKDLDLEALLKAGTLLYYRDGAAATVSVKRLTGTTTLAVDGKVDASNRSDMLTQKLVAHLPLLLHDNPREVGIIGLGSGATVGSALRHPIARADVLEISPEVVEASNYFTAENHKALDDPRTHLIVGDGRSHLLLAHRQYDVLISEPSNPWIAGVAALFTREFFLAARERLAPGGIICQWANAYNISEGDLRSIVATFLSVFPNGTAWLVGADDVLLVASTEPLDARLANLGHNWARPGVAEDLREVAVAEPFPVWTMFVGGPTELAQYGAGAAILTDDRMSLEFSAPRELHKRNAGDNGATLTALLKDGGPALIRDVKARAGAAEWRNRAAMWFKSSVYGMAYDDYVHALQLAPRDGEALDGLVRTAVLTDRAGDALSWVKSLTAEGETTTESRIAVSKLLAASGSGIDAIETAREACELRPVQPQACEQLASLLADAGNSAQLAEVVATLRQLAPERAATHYFAAVASFLAGNAEQTVRTANQAIAIDPRYAPVYDLIGAAYTKLGQPASARAAFLKSLEFDAHDSTAYTNLGLIELASGRRAEASRYFAEALWLEPKSPTARQGLARSRPGAPTW